MRSFLIAGNWKMNCGPKETAQLLQALKKELRDDKSEVEVLVCPPEISLTTAAEVLENTAIHYGAQNVYFEDNGAFTGEVSTNMLGEVGCSYVIVGHSERRDYFTETDQMVNLKTKKALEAGIKPIICVGEMLWQRKSDMHKRIVSKQVQAALSDVNKTSAADVVVAYEPIWAIGTGETATPEQAQEMHGMIREKLAELYDQKTADSIRILYGGSMKPHNAKELLLQHDVDGGLIGGASLKADSFAEIIKITKKIH